MLLFSLGVLGSYALSTLFSRQHNKHDLVFAGVEGGGTTWRVAIAKGSPTNIVERAEFDTKDPETTLGQVKAWLDAHDFDSIGVATFGPIEPKRGAPLYGHITSTPKKGWKNADVMGRLLDGVTRHKPHLFDTDVNAPALAEFMHFGTERGHSSCAYITVGTGVGVGLVVNGKTVSGLLHPEGGHLLLMCASAEKFNGTCPYHKNCVEGLVSAPALAKWAKLPQKSLPELDDDHAVWDHAANVLASLCASLLLLVSPERIVLSGGVMLRQGLLEKIHQKTLALLNGYIAVDQLLKHPEDIIQRSEYGNDSGLIGALTLAEAALNNSTSALQS